MGLEKIFILALAIGAAIFIALPFFRSKFKDKSEEGSDTLKNPLNEKLRRLNSQKESLYTALKEFDFDYSMGKLSKEDYEELRDKYKLQAIQVLKEIDDARQGMDTSDL